MSLDLAFSLVGSGICLLGAFLSFSLKSPKYAVFSLWFCGMGMGTIYMANGLELIAFSQWLASTLIAIGLLFVASLLKSKTTQLLFDRVPMVIGGLVSLFALEKIVRAHFGSETPVLVSPDFSRNLASFGESLVENYFVVVVSIGVILMISVVGFGVFSRKGDEA